MNDNIKENNRKWYENTYNKLIEKGKKRGLLKKSLDYYTEIHHIIPRCMGGKDDSSNLVLLTFKEHVIAHRLLTKIYPNERKLFAAVSFLTSVDKFSDTKIKISLRELDEIRKKSIDYLREINTGSNNPMFGKKISEEHKKILSEVNKRKRSEETRKRMSEAQKGKKATEEVRKKLSKIHKGMKVHSEERKKFLSEKWKNNNPNAVKILDPEGREFPTLKSCADFYKKDSQTIRNWIRKKPEKGFKYIN